MRTASLAPSGRVALRPIRAPRGGAYFTHALPRPGLGREVNLWRLRNLARVTWQALKVAVGGFVAKRCGLLHGYACLTLQKRTPEGIVDLGVASYRVVTDAGVAFIVDALHAAATIANLKYHGFGTGTTAESAGQTALVTELTTEYASDNTRPTGTQTESSANIYVTVATLSPDSGGTLAITEHGIFDQAANSGGTLLDRSKFSAVNLVASSDSLQATYSLTLTSGS